VTGDRTALWQDIDAPVGEFRWYLPERFNIARSCVDEQPRQDVALVVDDGDGEPRQYTFGELTEASARLATAFRRFGLERGDRVGVMVPQGLEVAVAHLACYRAGLIAVPLSVQFGPDALVYRLAHAGARALVVFEEGYARLQGVWGDLPALENVLLVGPPAAAEHTGATAFGEALAAAGASPGVVDTSATDPALLIYTFGTTGPPKGVLHRHQVVLAQLPGVRIPHDGFPQPGDVFWTPADWAWAGGLFDALLPSWLCGRPIVASRRKFSPEWAYELMSRHAIRNCFLPPTALKQMRQAGPPPPEVRLRSVASGGEPLGESVLAWARQNLGVQVNEFYGQTELNLVLGNGAGRQPVRPGSMGRPLPGFEVAVLDADGTPVRDGEPGEIAVALPHPGAFLEYWREPDRTAEKTHDGWLHTGDTATRDAEGYFWFGGRADDLISSGGYRIGPSEIEECLVSHPGVAMAAVIGIPDEVRGQAVAAFIVAADGADTDRLTTELQDHVKHRLAFYEYPRLIRFVDELPMTTTGKIQRAALRRRFTGETP
jgi:acetyl-CoA synthetase